MLDEYSIEQRATHISGCVEPERYGVLFRLRYSSGKWGYIQNHHWVLHF